MIAYVEKPPAVELHGHHFQLTVTSGGEDVHFLLTSKAFYGLKHYCSEADAKRRIADMEAQERVVQFRKPSARNTRREKA